MNKQKHKGPAILAGGGGILSNSRDSNLELFRIITMLFIVAHHYVVNSGLTSPDGPVYTNPTAWRSLFLLLFGAWGKTGINCFVLITGYFMCKYHITAKKYFKLLFEVWFYRIVIWSIFFMTGYEPFSLIEFLKVLTPIHGTGGGFSSCYLLFYLCIPFLNILIQNMRERQHLHLLAFCAFMYIILGIVPDFITMNLVSWFIVLYLMAAYIRMYPKKMFGNTKIWGIATVISVLVSAISVVCMTYISDWLRMGSTGAMYFVNTHQIPAVVTAVCAFMFFKNVRLKHSHIINTVAASTFGVLMIHANSDTMRRWLWRDVLDNVGMYSSPWMPVHAIVSAHVIFAVCAAIDYLRIRLIERPFFRLWDRYWPSFSARFEQIEIGVCKRLNIEI